MNNETIKVFEEIIKNKNDYINEFKKNIKNNIDKNNIRFIIDYQNMKLEEIKTYNVNLLDDAVLNSNDIYKIIELNNIKIIHLLNEKFKNNDVIDIVAKGPSAKKVEFGMGVNQGIIFTNQEFLFLNDIHSLFGIEKLLKNVKYIFFPDYPHYCDYNNSFNLIHASSLKSLNFRTLINYLKYFDFSGEIFIYKLKSSFNENKLNNFSFNSCTTTDIPVNFFSKFLFKNKFNTYGYQNGEGYHSNFKQLEFLDMNNFEYIQKIRLFNENPLFIKIYILMMHMYKYIHKYNVLNNKIIKNIIKINYINYDNCIDIY
jgi:hypothetical protein